ncbi:MAG TPA: RtcB family protein, partial [Planctomycetaceae bacterium]|nr:RtcB family protein [Planctomycetaceae bacterium]
IKCSMSLLQLDIPEEEVIDRHVRRELISAICQRTPTGTGRGQRSVPKGRPISRTIGAQAIVEGASESVCQQLGIPEHWAVRCEDAYHTGHDGTREALASRLDWLLEQRWMDNFSQKVAQLGSYGGGNHFGECEVVEVGGDDRAKSIADTFGLQDGKLAFLSHCGSRGLGHKLASGQFKSLQGKFKSWDIPLPGGDRELVYAPLGTPEANAYIDDMSLGANFATVNHLLINALVLEAFQEVFPGAKGELVYFISHNIARREVVDGKRAWVHRKGATRAFPGGHPALADTPFAMSGHPILLPGNPRDGSAVMVADPGAEKSCYSVNHGAGRIMGRKQAIRSLDQAVIDSELEQLDILSNCRQYPRDEAPAAYKDFNEVLRSVKEAELASEVARLKARFVIKDGSKADD